MPRFHRLGLPLCLVLGLGCSRPVAPKVAPPKPNPVEEAAIKFTNGLTDADRAEFYHLAEGSEVFPLDWLRALQNNETGKPFLEDLERMGFLPDPNNADGLAVGLTSAEARGLEPLGKMVGINCAACHVGEIMYKGKAMRIDGAPNLADTRTFFASLVESALATVKDPPKLLAFVSRLKASRSDQEQAAPSKIRQAARGLIVHLVEAEATTIKNALTPLVKALLDHEKKLPPVDLAPGPKQTPSDFRARMLASFPDLKELIDDSALLKGPLESLANAAERKGSVLHTLEEIYIGARLLRARVVYLEKLGIVGKDPRTVWGPGRVDAFGSARAFLFQTGYPPLAPVSYPHLFNFEHLSWLHYDGNTTSVMERNMGQALGVGAVYDDKTLASTLIPVNLNRLEQLAAKITPPAWPEKLLGALDQAKVQRGSTLYVKHCVECHKIMKSDETAPDLLIALDKIGTDPVRAQTFAEKLPSGPFKDQPFCDAIKDTMAKIKVKAYEDNQIDAAQQKIFERDRKVAWRGPDKYANRPLVAVWATAPYLHNGSVPTLDDLLRPAKDRPKTFFVGSREYDPVKLGYVSKVDGKKDNFDTATPGNRNIGHEYGTDLTEPERMDLLEYLKVAGSEPASKVAGGAAP